MVEKVLIHHIGQLCTNEPLTKKNTIGTVDKKDLGLIDDAWMLIDETGKVADFGQQPIPPQYKHIKSVDAQNKLVIPGLIDSHTHPIFGGKRFFEFAMRLEGATYEMIAAKGGGIKASFLGTSIAKDEDLIQKTLSFSQYALSYGVTALEMKSGYGHDVFQELRLLRLLNKVKNLIPQHVSVTAMCLHAIPSNYANAKDWAKVCEEEVLPLVKEEKLATFVDMFIERGYFSVSDCESFVQKSIELGLKIKVHADEFSDVGACEAAARWGAVSADHLQMSTDIGLKALASKDVVATLLPGTSLYAKIPFTQASKMKKAGCAIAIATDYNPGSCSLMNLPFLATMAGLHCGLTLPELFCGVTFAAAKALNLQSFKGALAKSYDGDFSISEFSNIEEWVADAGQTRPLSVWVKGVNVFDSTKTPLR